MIWNVVESINPWYEKPSITPFWLWIYDEDHAKLYKFGMRELRKKRLTRKFIKTIVEGCYVGNNMGGADIVQFISPHCVKKKYKVEI